MFWFCFSRDVIVTKQNRACPLIALMHDPMTSVEGGKFLFTGVQPRGAGDTPAQSPVLLQDPAFQAISQKHAPKFPISSSVLKPVAQTILHPLWKLHSWVSELPSSRSSSLLQHLGYIVISLYVVVQETCAMLHQVMVESGEAHVPREWLLCTSFREAEVYIPGHSSVPKHLLRIRAWLGRFPHSSISFADPHTTPSALSSARMAAFLTTPGRVAES